jgi:hydroxyacylglutathione hydrolase
MLNIIPLPALDDNYIWAIHGREGTLVIVDPGEAGPVRKYLRQTGLRLAAILCTHRHHDHVDGIAELRGVYNVPVYGRSHPANPHITHALREGDRLSLDCLPVIFDIWELPGHLDDHIAYVAPGAVFCGDILFGAGCGKNFEGSLHQLFESVQRLGRLPGDTLLYSAHEYTEYNLPFAACCEPDNATIRQRIEETRTLLAAVRPTVPFTVALEKATNPFLRLDQPGIVAKLAAQGLADHSPASVFAALRRWRDSF